jgi:hypothetical protein
MCFSICLKAVIGQYSIAPDTIYESCSAGCCLLGSFAQDSPHVCQNFEIKLPTPHLYMEGKSADQKMNHSRHQRCMIYYR